MTPTNYNIETICYHITNDEYFVSFKLKNGTVIESNIDKENMRDIITTLDNKLR